MKKIHVPPKFDISWLLVLVSGAGYTALISSTYIVSMQYALFQSATGFTNVQMGTIGSFVGLVALLGYPLGGILSDFVKTKTLMLISHLAAPVLLLVMSTLPKYEIVLTVQFALAFFSIFTYWAPMAKFVSGLGPREQEGKRYGFFLAAASVSGTLIGMAGSYLAEIFDSVTAMRLVYYIYAGLNVTVAVTLALFYKPEAKSDSGGGSNRFQFKYAAEVLKMPAIWLIGIMGFAGYVTGKFIAYSAPFMQDVFSASISTVTLINSLAYYGVAVFMSPLAGMFTDKIKSATRAMLYMLICFGACMIFLIIMPWKQGLFPLVVTVVFLVSAFDAVGQTNWFTPLSEVSIPPQVKGTAIGIISVMMFSSDAFAFLIFGNMLDKNGHDGFYHIFFSIALIVLIGIIATLILRRKVLPKKRL